MTEESIFNSEEKPTSSEQEAPPVNQQPSVPPELQDWVGPGKKYQSVEEVYKAFPNAQTHIQSQKERIEQLEAELGKRKSAEEILEEIRSSSTGQQKPTSQGVEVNESVLSELVEKKLQQHVTQQNQQQNWSKIEEAFTSTFREKADEQFVNIARQNNLSVDEFKSLARKSPQLVLNLAGINKQQQKVASSHFQGDVNTQATKSVNQDEELSAKVKMGATGKDLARAWAATRKKVYKQHNIEE